MLDVDRRTVVAGIVVMAVVGMLGVPLAAASDFTDGTKDPDIYISSTWEEGCDQDSENDYVYDEDEEFWVELKNDGGADGSVVVEASWDGGGGSKAATVSAGGTRIVVFDIPRWACGTTSAWLG